jgi:hypothetical protein
LSISEADDRCFGGVFYKNIFWGLFVFLDLAYKINISHILFENLALYSKYENICDEVTPSTEMAANILAKLLIIQKSC